MARHASSAGATTPATNYGAGHGYTPAIQGVPFHADGTNREVGAGTVTGRSGGATAGASTGPSGDSRRCLNIAIARESYGSGRCARHAAAGARATGSALATVHGDLADEGSTAGIRCS